MTVEQEAAAPAHRRPEQPAALAPFLRDRIGDASVLPEDFMRSQPGWRQPAGVQVLHLVTPGPLGVPVRVYRPDSAMQRTGQGRPGLLWFHGGGFVGGSQDWGEAHALGSEIAARAGVLVASVGYRTDGYAAAAQDAATAWAWFASRAADLGAAGPLAVGGASAGANLALSLAAGHLDPPRHGAAPARPAVFLGAYGLYHGQVDPLDPVTAAVMAGLPESLRFRPDDVAARTVASQRGADHAWAAVPGEGDLDAVPRAVLVDCELDDLRPSTERLARRFAELGTPVEVHHAPGVLHGHLNWLPGAELPQVEQTIDHLARALLGLDGHRTT